MRLNRTTVRKQEDGTVVTKKYWLLKMGDLVELRASIYPIKAYKTKLTRTRMMKYQVEEFDNLSGRYRLKTVEKPTKTVLEQTYFEGGKVLATFCFSRVHRWGQDLGLPPMKGDMAIKLTREVAKTLQRRKG